jgi:transcriptional regulator with XRE-family HTH domain
MKYTYHHGRTIKEYRELRRMTQAQLAEVWPKSGGTEQGVNTRYVQDVEYGHKHIEDPQVLRKLAAILDIPLWKFGLSEYDPFNPHTLPGHGRSFFAETLDAAEGLIEDAWRLRRAVPLPMTEKTVERLNTLFAYFRVYLPPPLQLEERFIVLHAQVQLLNAVIHVERKRYTKALATFEAMYATTREVSKPAPLAMALMGIGTELERAGKQHEAVDRLEQARDVSLRASKQVMAVIHSYLARAYAGLHDELHFERAIDVAQTLANDLGERYGDGTDFVFHSLSGTLAERSYGYLDVKQPKKTLAMKKEIIRQITQEQNTYVNAWLPLDWARAYMMLKEIEESVNAARLFLHRTSALQSPHAKSRAYAYLQALEQRGYQDVQEVKDFREELNEAEHTQEKEKKQK